MASSKTKESNNTLVKNSQSTANQHNFSNVDINTNQSTQSKSGYLFYYKLMLLYFLNIIDWFCTEALLSSGKFIEANPIMQPILTDFWMTLLIKGGLPLFLIIICALIYKISDCEISYWVNFLLNIGITAYSLVNLWHIINFVLLFFVFWCKMIMYEQN